MKNQAFCSLMVGLSLALAGCGSEGTGTGGAGGTSSASSSSATTSASTGVGGAGTTTTTGTGGTGTGGAGGAAGAPEAPIMTGAAKVAGALHVTWTNVTSDCDKIELWRNHDAAGYAVAYTLTGAATSQHDTQAVPPGMYCYKARCLKGTSTSPDSNEKCGTP